MGRNQVLDDLLQEHVKPFVKKIDTDAYYAKSYIQALGKAGFFRSVGVDREEYLLREFQVVYETSKICMTTGFVVWCNLAFLTYLRNSTNTALKNQFLPKFESGEWIGATGLSNPMKSYVGLEKIHLKAEQVVDGFKLSGTLPAVSNLGDEHWFTVLAEGEHGQKIIAFLPTERKGLSLVEKNGFLAVNGSATYTCQFQEVFIPNEWLLATNADAFIEKIRPAFVFYQIPMGLGVIDAALVSIRNAKDYQFGGNQYLPVQARTFVQQYEALTKHAEVFTKNFDEVEWADILEIRLEVALLALQVVQTEMIHQGSSGYLQKSAPSRRLREAYFYTNLTPTVRHLNKLLRQKIS